MEGLPATKNVTNPIPLKFDRILHKQEPDFTTPLLNIPHEDRERISARLSRLYSETVSRDCMPELERMLKVYYAHKPQEMIDKEREFKPAERFTEEDMILITYGDLLRGKERSPLASLIKFFDTGPRIREGIRTINTLHILPFFPYSSDKGFAITDFKAVDPNLGTWQDIEELGKRFKLMFDGVFNHASSKSPAFQEFLNGNSFYEDFFIAYSSPDALREEQRRMIVRPRTSDILTKFQSINGPVYVWTTFSPDQIDINYKSPKVLLKVIENLLLYVRRGADIIRLDAVTYFWHDPGTKCAQLEQTHEIIKLFRDVLNVVAPRVSLVTETNVPHEENVSYFGNGYDEAQMVYNFALPPLVLHAFYKENATTLSGWARDLEFVSDASTFLNILDSHDGVGLMGVKNILSKEDVDFIIQRAREHGAFISYKTDEDGNDEPYEINTTWFSALNYDDSNEDITFQVKRFVASRSIALVIRGIPGFYFHGLIGTLNDTESVLATKSKRDINRKVIDEKDIVEPLKNPLSKLSQIRNEFGRIMEIRRKEPAFHPNGEQHILTFSPAIFSVLRISPKGNEHILTLTNVTNKACCIEVPVSELGTQETHWYDLVGKKGKIANNHQKLEITMQPYDVIWLKPYGEIEKSIET